jgi:hypothetical protein
MLWILGAIVMVAWLVLKFLLHKSGMVHILLLIAISCFVIQLVQDLRTKAYERSLLG